MASTAPTRPVSARLAIAILLAPGIFAWFTLRSGYSTMARLVSFAWMIVGGFLFLGVMASTPTGTANAPRTAAPVDAPVPSTVQPQTAAPQRTPSAPAQDPTSGAGFGQAAAGATGMAVTAQELATAYEGNEVAAQAKYGNQQLVVTGVVEKVGLDLLDNPQISLVGDGVFRTVTVQLDKSASSAAAAINKGQSLTVRCGKVSEVMSMPVLNDCTL